MYLISLKRIGLVAQDQDGRYLPGAKIRTIAALASDQDPIMIEAKRLITNFGHETRWPVMLSVWGRRGPVIIGSYEAPFLLPIVFRVGTTFPLDSATALLFLSFLPGSVARKVWASGDILETDELRSKLTDIRAQGYAEAAARLSADFQSSTYSAVAVPIFGAARTIEIGITALFPMDLSADKRSKHLGRLLDGAASISQMAGRAR